MSNKVMSREGLIKFRKDIKNHLIEVDSLNKITECLIDYPKMSHIESPYPNKRLTTKVISKGYGAFGETENEYQDYVYVDEKGLDVIYDNNLLIISEEDKVIGVVRGLDFKKLKQELKNKLERDVKESLNYE